MVSNGPDASARSEAPCDFLNQADLSILHDPATGGAAMTLSTGLGSASELGGDSAIAGRYRLCGIIGEGGFGTVYRAQQEYPVRREVALKLIKLGMDTRAVVARFEAERQALASMEHPGVAKVFDAGCTTQGRPFFVMELVSGEPITEYCRRNSLSTRHKLELFARVCNAVAHAHARGIIHRDLKPSNVLVSLQDSQAVPKVIDFGIAKAISNTASTATILTEQRQFLGTPEYMSPEQASGSADIDTRADVYSLGVLLYELVTGTPPFDSRRLRRASHEEIQRIIRQEDPPPPSLRVSGLRSVVSGRVEASNGTLSGDRPSSAKLLSLTRELRGDLDWIIARAMEKDRARRYDSVNALAADIRRHLNHEPVEASPPSMSYRLGKLARRHTVALASAAAILLALLVGLSTTTIGFVQARREATRAHKAEVDALAQRDAAFRAEHDAQTARQEAEEVISFLVDMLGAADPGSMGRNTTVRQVLDQASAELGNKFTDRPLVEARLADVMGRTYQSLGFFEQAERYLSKALEARVAAEGYTSQTLLAMSRLGVLYHVSGRTTEGRQLIDEGLELAQSSLGPDHEVTLTLLQNRGALLRAEGRMAEAEDVLRDALERTAGRFGDESERALAAKHNLALLLQTSGRFEEALELTGEVATARRKSSGPRHPQTLLIMQNLAALLDQTGRPDQGRRILESTLQQARQVWGRDHPRTTALERNLLVIRLNAGEIEATLPLAKRLLALDERNFGPESSRAIHSKLTLAAVHRRRGELDEARGLAEEALLAARQALGRDHEVTLQCMSGLAAVLEKQATAQEAIALLEEALATAKASYGDAHPYTIPLLRALAGALDREKLYARSADVHVRLLRAQRALQRRHGDQTIRLAISAAAALGASGRAGEAELLLRELYDECLQANGGEHQTTVAARRALADFYRRTGNNQKLEALGLGPPDQKPT